MLLVVGMLVTVLLLEKKACPKNEKGKKGHTFLLFGAESMSEKRERQKRGHEFGLFGKRSVSEK